MVEEEKVVTGNIESQTMRPIPKSDPLWAHSLTAGVYSVGVEHMTVVELRSISLMVGLPDGVVKKEVLDRLVAHFGQSPVG